MRSRLQRAEGGETLKGKNDEAVGEYEAGVSEDDRGAFSQTRHGEDSGQPTMFDSVVEIASRGAVLPPVSGPPLGSRSRRRQSLTVGSDSLFNDCEEIRPVSGDRIWIVERHSYAPSNPISKVVSSIGPPVI